METFVRYSFQGVRFIISQSSRQRIFIEYNSVDNLSRRVSNSLEDLTTNIDGTEAVNYADFEAAAVAESVNDIELVKFGYGLSERLLKSYALHCESNNMPLINTTNAQLEAARENHYLPYHRDFKALMFDVIESNKIGVADGKNYCCAMKHVHDRIYSTMFGHRAKDFREIVNEDKTYQPVTRTSGVEVIKLVGEAFRLAESILEMRYADIDDFSQILDIVESAAIAVASRQGNAKQIATLKASVRLGM